jgi:hypothetical protein
MEAIMPHNITRFLIGTIGLVGVSSIGGAQPPVNREAPLLRKPRSGSMTIRTSSRSFFMTVG